MERDVLDGGIVEQLGHILSVVDNVEDPREPGKRNESNGACNPKIIVNYLGLCSKN